MQDEFNISPARLQVTFGPAIRACCYEVGEEFRGYFNYGLNNKQGRYYLDLAGINKRQLLDAGVREENISDSGLCTSCRSKEFFSYRREGSSSGRMISVVMLREGSVK